VPTSSIKIADSKLPINNQGFGFYTALFGFASQEPTPSTALEPYITTLGNRMVYTFNYPSTSVTGAPVVLSSLLCCWAPPTPPKGLYIVNGKKVVIK
jgi:hypothetical protein